MNPEFQNECQELAAAQADYKILVQRAVDSFKSLIPPNKKIIIEYKDAPYKPGGSGRLIQSWKKSETAVLGLYLPDGKNEIQKCQKQMPFLPAHEVSHLFEDLFEHFKGALSSEEIKRSLDSKLNNPMVVSGQGETVVDLIALKMAEEDSDLKARSIESYLNIIKDYLSHPTDRDLRDDVRFLEVLNYLAGEEGDSFEAMAEIRGELQKKIDDQLIDASDLDKAMFQKYQKFIKNIVDKFQGEFLGAEWLKAFLKEKLGEKFGAKLR